MNVPSAGSRRRYRSRSEVQDLVRQFHQSGVSAKDFAARMGVHPMSVRRWIRISPLQASTPNAKPRFSPVQLRPPNRKRLVKDMVPIVGGYEKIAGS